MKDLRILVSEAGYFDVYVSVLECNNLPIRDIRDIHHEPHIGSGCLTIMYMYIYIYILST